MSSLQKKLLTSDMDFQTCGQIMVAAKHNTYAMSCNFCQQKFAQIQTFMRHLQMLHTDRVEFGEKDKDVEVYAVEELMNTFSQTPTEEDCQSEESGVVEEEEDDNWLTEEDKKWLDEGEMMERNVIKGKGLKKVLQNMSILKALEDCDVTMNFGDNLDGTVIEEECDKENEEGVGKGEDKEGDCVLSNTLLQEIQQDWNASDEDSRENDDIVKDLEDLEADVTMTEDCEEIKTDLRTKSSGLKGLLQGLEDLEDVDSLLDNLEDTVRKNPSDIKKPKVINLLESGKKSNKTDSILETTAMDDLNFTFRVNEKVPKEDNVVNFKLTKKSLKKLPKVNKNLNKSQQKMLINVHTGELEEVDSDSQPSEDSLDSENSAFENFKRKNNEKLEYDPEDSIMEEIKKQLKKPKEEERTEKCLINNFLETKTKKVRKNYKISKISQEQDENSDLENFNAQLKSIQESLEDEDNNSEDNSKHIADNSDSNDTLDFDLQLKNLEASLNEENNDNIKSTAKINTDFKISQNPDKYSKMRPTNLMKVLDLELSANEEDLLKENSKEMDKKSKMQAIGLEILKKKLKSSKIEENCNDKSKNSKEFTTSKGNSYKISKNSKESSSSKENFLKVSKNAKELSSSSKDFNKDLTKALSDALEGDDLDLFNFGEDNEPPLNQNLQDLLTQELMEEDSREEAIKQSTNLNIKEVSKKKVQQKVIKSPTNDCSKSRYSKTNLKAKNKQQTTLKSNDNLKSHVSTTQTSQITFQTSEVKQNLKHLDNKSLSQNSLKPKKPKNFKENEVNLQVNLNPGLRNISNQENLTPVFIKKIKKEKFTPLPSFINTERGDKTPLRHEEIFLKNSPQTLEKNESLLSNFTPTKGETTLNTKEKIFLKQSPKTQEKQGELIKNKTPITLEKNENVSLQRNPKTPGKLNNITNQKMLSQNVINFSPQKSTKNILQNYSKISPLKRQVFLSPSKSNKENSKQLTSQKIKNMAIKLPKLTPEKVKNLQKSSNYSKNLADTKKSPLNAENKTQFNNFKLPNGITLTKVSPSNNKLPANQLKPSPSSLSKQNPTNIKESQQSQANLDVFNLILNRNVPDLKTSLVKPLKQQNTQSKLRQRKASIDIVPHTQRPSHQASLAKPTPKLNNLDYKSYAVNRSARKKEVLQRMRHVKKQIFKSIENGEEITKISKINASNLNKINEKFKNLPNLQIKNVPKHQFDDFKKPSTISSKNLNDDEKQAKKSLNVPISSSPINDDEKLMKKSLKRPAISPIQGDQAKRLQKSSPFMENNQNGNQSSELETTKLDLSESVVDFLQSDLKRTRLNVASFLNEDFPTDDNTPNKTSIESNENHKKIREKQKDTNTIDSGNILDDLLSQVDNEQKISDEKTPANETTNAQDLVIDFDEARDINLLNKFGLKIIKNAEIEDVMPFEEIEQSQEKAKNFAEIYRYYQRIWCSKNGENPNLRQELDICFKQMLTQANQIFNLELSMIDIKRLVNLISLWYVQNFNSKLIEKKNISEATNRYLQIFSFIPKTVKRFYYCEYCDECFTTEHKYFTHRIVHTGAQYPYSCSKCSMGFKILKMSKTHEQHCTIQNKNTASKSVAKNTANHLKCPVCKEIFVTSKLLYEHSKTHLKTVYNCVKCELVFASATDVQKHMTLCNRNIKRIPKQYTPRPSTTKSKIET